MFFCVRQPRPHGRFVNITGGEEGRGFNTSVSMHDPPSPSIHDPSLPSRAQSVNKGGPQYWYMHGALCEQRPIRTPAKPFPPKKGTASAGKIVYSNQVGHQTSDTRLLWTAITQP